MTMTDPIADYATRIRNAIRVGKHEVTMPHSRMKTGISEVLKREGYIDDFSVEAGHVQGVLRLKLKYGADGEKVIQRIQRVSKPGRRIYFRADDVKPVLRGMGITVITTTHGILSNREARQHHVGGEPLLEIW